MWSFKDDSGNYIAYDNVFNGRVEKSFLTGVEKDVVAYSGTKYDIDFTALTQRNHESGKVRGIQRSESRWFYREDSGKYKPFDDALSAKLEVAALNSTSDSFIFVMFNTNYTICLSEMAQKNPDSGKVRKLARRGSNVPLPTHTPTAGAGEPATKKAQVEDGSGAKKSVAASLCTTIPMPGTSASSNNDNGSSSAAVATSSNPASSAGGYNKSAGGNGNVTTAIMKNGGVVDTHSGLQHTYHVFSDNFNGLCQCMLNQTNIGQNNNKYYVIQLLEVDAGQSGTPYYVFTRWGRVGSPGQQAMDGFTTSQQAFNAFDKKFRDKTSNTWSNRANFTKVPGKYHLMDIDLGASTDGVGTSSLTGPGVPLTANGQPMPIPPSQLDATLQRVMKLISNKSEMTQVMKELKIDTDKMPLGKISKKQIKEAFEFLKQIEKEILAGNTHSTTINHASSMFYTLIPHNFGFHVPPMINTQDMLKEKMKLLEVMGDLEIAAKLLNEGGAKVDKNPLDSTYESLKCQLTPLSKASAEFSRVKDYVANTHGDTHKQYKLVVEEVFAVVRPGEAERYKAYAHLPNKTMLWHGSRTTNYMGILSQGLRIAPPEAPVTGYMFGKGVYFADCSSKSANYCHTSPSNNVGFALLCEVALGTMKDYKGAQYMDKPQPNSNSTRGLGRSAPNPSGAVVVDGVTWPLGKMSHCPEGNGSTLLYPEYIVYDVAQCVTKYMVQLRFEYGSKW